MTFDELRAAIASEMPPGWAARCDEDHGHYYLVVRTVVERSCDCHRVAADTPEALLAAWRELKGRLG